MAPAASAADADRLGQERRHFPSRWRAPLQARSLRSRVPPSRYRPLRSRGQGGRGDPADPRLPGPKGRLTSRVQEGADATLSKSEPSGGNLTLGTQRLGQLRVETSHRAALLPPTWKDNGKSFLRRLWVAERQISERLKSLRGGPPSWPKIDGERAVGWVEGEAWREAGRPRPAFR